MRFQIGFRLVSDWFQIGTKNFRLRLQISDCFRLLQIDSDWFRLIQIDSDWFILIQIHLRIAVLKKIRLALWKKSFQTVVWKIVKVLDFFFIFLIASDSWELSVYECRSYYCLHRGGERCLRHIHQGGGEAVTDRPGDMDGVRSWQPGETDGGCGVGGQKIQEGNEGGRWRIWGQNRQRLLIFLGRSTYRQV